MYSIVGRVMLNYLCVICVKFEVRKAVNWMFCGVIVERAVKFVVHYSNGDTGYMISTRWEEVVSTNGVATSKGK